MTDPLDVLRAPIPLIDPDPMFAERLRERLRRAILHSQGAAMTTQSTSAIVTDPAELAWGPTITPYLMVNDRRALDWYVEVFDAERRGEPYIGPRGAIDHAELGIGDAVLMLAEDPDLDPATQVGGQSLFVSVPDVDETIRRAVAGGAGLERPAADEPYGRTGVIIDPFGHRWMVNTRPRSATQARPGDMIYMTLFVRDEEALRGFYGSVLGDRVLEHQTNPAVSIWGIHHDPPASGAHPLGPIPIYRVVDVDTAVERVRAAGGNADQPEHRHYGYTASCIDPEGNRFDVWQPPGA